MRWLGLAPLIVFGGLSGGSAYAQENPLVGGHWLSTSRSQDPASQGGWAYDLRFLPNGQVILMVVVANAYTWLFFNYRMTGANSYEAIAVDYRPKRLPPFMPIGTHLYCRFGFESSAVVDIQCNNSPAAQYTRQE
jgi:hypothetical protein